MPEELPGYVTAEDIIAATGTQPGDFRLTETQELVDLLTRWSRYVKGLIDDHCSRDFAARADQQLDQVPQTVRSVAERAMARWVNQVRQHRDGGMVRLDEWRVAIDIVDEVLPRHLRDDLDRHMRSSRPKALRGFVSHGG